MEGETSCSERPPWLAGTGIGAEYESYDWCEQNLRWWFAGGTWNYLKFILKLYTLNCPFHTSHRTESLSVHHQYFNLNLQPIYNYESFLNRKLEFFTWAQIISQLLVWGNWLGGMITINKYVRNSTSATSQIQQTGYPYSNIDERVHSMFNNESRKESKDDWSFSWRFLNLASFETFPSLMFGKHIINLRAEMNLFYSLTKNWTEIPHHQIFC